MRVSVIVTEYNKRGFLKGAVLSVLNQSLDKDKYEVIVVKNYEDEELDKWLRTNNVRVLIVDDKSLGGKIKIGLEESTGEIVSLLEDDDLFHPRKLEYLYKIFSVDKDLGYVKNGLVTFKDTIVIHDLSMNDMNKNNLHKWKRRDLLHPKTLNIALRKRIGFQNSSISVKRDLLEKVVQDLVNYSVAVDLGIFFLLLNLRLDYDLAVLDIPLTFYRLSLNKEIGNVLELYSRRIKEMIGTLDLILSKVDNESLRRYLFHTYSRSNIIYNVLVNNSELGKKKINIILKDIKTLLSNPFFRDYLSSHEPNYKFVAIGLLSLLFPEFSRRLLANRWSKSYYS